MFDALNCSRIKIVVCRRNAFRKFFMALFAFIFMLQGNVSVYSFEVPSLDSLAQEARENNPEIQAAKKRWEASLSRIPQAKSLDSPSIGFNFMKIPKGTLKIDRTMPEDRLFSISQMFPFFGKLSLKGKIALVESQMVASEYKDKELEIINTVRNAYYSLFLHNKEIELNLESLQLLKDIAEIAEANYAVGNIAQEEVRKINLEIAQLTTAITNLQEEKASKETLLNALLNRKPDSLFGPVQLKEDIAFNQDTNKLYELALQYQPELAIFAYLIERNKNVAALAKRSIFPDVMSTITLRGISSGGIGPWDLMLAFSLPFWFWTKQRYEIKEALINLDQAKAAYIGMQNKAFAEIRDLVARIKIARNKMTLYSKNLIPIIESAISASLAGYRAGESNLMLLLDSERMLIETKMHYYRALVDYYMSMADLERAIGASLSEVPNEKK